MVVLFEEAIPFLEVKCAMGFLWFFPVFSMYPLPSIKVILYMVTLSMKIKSQCMRASMYPA